MYTHTKRKVCVTLDVECYEDLNLEDINWKDILGLEGDESLYVTIKDEDDIW